MIADHQPYGKGNSHFCGDSTENMPEVGVIGAKKSRRKSCRHLHKTLVIGLFGGFGGPLSSPLKARSGPSDAALDFEHGRRRPDLARLEPQLVGELVGGAWLGEGIQYLAGDGVDLTNRFGGYGLVALAGDCSMWNNRRLARRTGRTGHAGLSRQCGLIGDGLRALVEISGAAFDDFDDFAGVCDEVGAGFEEVVAAGGGD